MDKTTKTILIALGSVLILCGCVASVVFWIGIWSFGRFATWTERSVSVIPEKAIQVGAEIADYEVPDGFGSPFGVHIGDVTVFGYTSQSERSQILLAQFPEGTSINTKELLKLISKYAADPNSGWYNTEFTLVEERPVTIRGQACTLNVSEGTSGEGIVYRSGIANFHGRGGPALVIIAAPLDEWDIEVVESFIEAIH